MCPTDDPLQRRTGENSLVYVLIALLPNVTMGTYDEDTAPYGPKEVLIGGSLITTVLSNIDASNLHCTGLK